MSSALGWNIAFGNGAHENNKKLQAAAWRRQASGCSFLLFQSIGTEKINAIIGILPLLLLALIVILCYNFG